ncbi:CxxC-x17-CxxC domain-containing protein [Candidatus Omnitrophota bacterium]
MKKSFKRKGSLSSLKIETDVAVLMNKMQQQLITLEQKIDALSNRLPEKHFSKSSDRFHRYGNRKQGDRSRTRNFTVAVCADCNSECEVPFKPSGDRPVYCKECFSKHKGGNSFKENFDSKSREGDFSQGRRFNRKRGGENQGSEKKGKSIFRRRKVRI